MLRCTELVRLSSDILGNSLPASETAMPWHERLIDECQTAFRK